MDALEDGTADVAGIGVQARHEGAVLVAQLPFQETGDAVGGAFQQRPQSLVVVGGAAPAADVGAQQQGVVVEHLLEVRHHPARIDGVAVETPADLVADAAARHRLQAALSQLQAAGVATHQQRIQRRRGRELRGGSETGVDQVEVGGDRLDGGVDLGSVVRQGCCGEGRQMFGHHIRARGQGWPVVFPGVGQGLQDLHE